MKHLLGMIGIAAMLLTAVTIMMMTGGCMAKPEIDNQHAAGSVRVMTCNLRGALIPDGQDSWETRRPICLEALQNENADIYCFQEMQTPNREAIEEAFPDYRFFAALDQPLGGHPMNGIMYRKSRFRELGAGTYALSEHPHMIGSTDWDHVCPRFVNFLVLQELSTGKVFRIVNTHLDHISQVAREKGTALIIEESAAYPPDMPQILTGDMNSSIENLALQQLLQAGWLDSFREATGVTEPGFTYHAFQGPEYKGEPAGKIDFIFVRGAWDIQSSRIVKECGSSGRYPSDHYFVTADLVLK